MITLQPDSIQNVHPDSLQDVLPQEVTSSATPDSVRPRKFSVYRIAQSMPNATPSQLDSAIQANLPVRERHLSTRPDTLNIPGLVGRNPYASLDSLPVAYRQGYFANDSLLHPELQVHPTGYVADPLPYRLWSDDWVTGTLLIVFLIGVFLIHRSRKFFLLQAKNFFFPTNEMKNASPIETSIGGDTNFLTTLLLSIMGALVAFGYIQYEYGIFLGTLSPYVLLGLFVAGWLLYFFFRRMIYSFVNWIFFNKEQRRFFNEAYSFLLSLEAILIFPAILVAVYFNIPPLYCLFGTLSLVILVKLLLAYKSYFIFFKNLFGSFHLIVYLCALEVAPLVIIWKILMRTVDILISKI